MAQFDKYAQALKSGTERTRSIAYVLILVTIASATVVRNHIFPAWDQERFKLTKSMYECWEQNSVHSPIKQKDQECRRLLTLASQGLSISLYEMDESGKELDFSKKKAEKSLDVNIMKHRLEHLRKITTELTIITIPVFGSSVHINDYWIVSGGMTSFLLGLLVLSLRKELADLALAADNANNNAQNLAAISLSQFLIFTPSYRCVGFIVLWVPVAAHLAIVASDYRTFMNSVELIGWIYSALEYFFETALAGLVVYLAYRATRLGMTYSTNITAVIGPPPAQSSTA